MTMLDRLVTIAATATLTSAVWIVAGGSLIENAGTDAEPAATRPAEAAPGGERRPVAAPLDTRTARDLPPERDGTLLVPVLNVRPADLADTFVDERGGGTRLHEAIDIMAPTGTTVVAAGPGEVEKLFRSDAGGLTIYVRSPDRRTIHYYAHLDAYAPGLREGQRVRRGQRLGTVGATGNADPGAPHLHFAVMRTTPDAAWWEPATSLNPYPLLAGRR